ncbi:MAG TPA: hypothetical protein VF036_04675 [Actinomycetota bacterium]
MNKRSAVLIAAGLVLTLAIGGLAVSLGLTGPTPVNAAGPARPERVVKVERRTVTIHQKAGSPSAATVMLSAPASDPAIDGDSDDGYDEDASEHEDESHEESEEVESEDVG